MIKKQRITLLTLIVGLAAVLALAQLAWASEDKINKLEPTPFSQAIDEVHHPTGQASEVVTVIPTAELENVQDMTKDNVMQGMMYLMKSREMQEMMDIMDSKEVMNMMNKADAQKMMEQCEQLLKQSI